MATSRIYPGSSEMDMGVSSISYRGGSMSTIGHAEMETQRARMTLEEARWTGVRKKIPGMSGIPSKPRTMGQNSVEETDPLTQFMNEQRTFIRQHFRQKECSRFVPKPGQKVKKSRDLKCHCGDILTEHAGMHGPFPHFSSEEMMEDFIVPKELRRIMSKEQRNNPPPDKLPNVPWDPKEAIRVTATCTYGKINFINVEQAGGKKPAKYIRMTDEDSVDNLIELMKTFWKIEQPEKPHLVITVIGGAKNFKLDGRMRDTFSTGLIKAAKTTNAWLISSGFNMGVMKSVGQAVRQGQSFCWDNNRMAHVLRCIGIAPWGYVKNRRQLESIDGQMKLQYIFTKLIGMVIPALSIFRGVVAPPVNGGADPVAEFTMRPGVHDALDWISPDSDMTSIAQTSESHIESTEECPTTIKYGASLLVNEKSSCPWYYAADHSKSRYPATILRAVSKCRRCIGSADLECHPILRQITVLTQNGTDATTGNVRYGAKEINIPVGYSCGGPNLVNNAATAAPVTDAPQQDIPGIPGVFKRK